MTEGTGSGGSVSVGSGTVGSPLGVGLSVGLAGWLEVGLAVGLRVRFPVGLVVPLEVDDGERDVAGVGEDGLVVRDVGAPLPLTPPGGLVRGASPGGTALPFGAEGTRRLSIELASLPITVTRAREVSARWRAPTGNEGRTAAMPLRWAV